MVSRLEPSVRSPGPVVGREAEMRLVETFLDEVALSPSALVFEGEPGIGKSTLWNMASAIAAERSFLVLSTRPAESEAKLSYTAITDLLADHLEALAELPEPQRAALEVALLQRKATRRGPDHRTISVAFLGTIRSLSRAGPMIIAVDDAQWLDAPSARVIEFALRRLDDETIGVVATARTGPDQRFLPQPAPAIDGSRFHRVVVGPLSVDAISRLVRARLEVNLPLDVIKALHRTSGG